MILRTPSRIHMTLIDMNGETGRVDGGVGLALEEPALEVKVEKAGGVSARGPMAERVQDAAEKVLEAIGVDGGVEIDVTSAYPQHVGLGSGTQVALAVGKGICGLYGVDRTVRDIAIMVGRGGTSGIGTAAFEHGGFIVDGGHSRKEKPDFLPSSASNAFPPPIIARHDFPDWKVVLCLPKKDEGISGEKEVNIFQENCPVPMDEVQALSHIILMKMLPAVLENDISAFGRGVNTIQTMGFKKVEVDLQPTYIKDILTVCQDHSRGAGLSSFGPLIYSITDDEGPLVDALGERDDIQEVMVTRARNQGVVTG